MSGIGNSVVEIQPCDSELLTAILVDQLHGGAVFLGALEVVARDVGAEDSPGEVVVLEERSSGEADEYATWQQSLHRFMELAALGTMTLVHKNE